MSATDRPGAADGSPSLHEASGEWRALVSQPLMELLDLEQGLSEASRETIGQVLRNVACLSRDAESGWVDVDLDQDASATQRPQLMVVEDEPELARFLAASLRGEYRVEIAGDAREALDLLQSHQIDMVVLDRVLPDFDVLVGGIRHDPDLRDLPVVAVSVRDADVVSTGELEADDHITPPFSVRELRARLSANLLRARQRSAHSAWRRAILFSLYDPLVIFDTDGLVIELNQAFTTLFGYSLADGPLRPPYPWWPTEGEDADALDAIRTLHQQATASQDVSADVVFYTRDRQRVWVNSVGTNVDLPDAGLSARIRVLRDITRAKQAQERRAAAARVSADFGRTDDLATLLGVAEHGFELLFDGDATIQIDLDGRQLIDTGGTLDEAALSADISIGLGGQPSADTSSLRPGILLVPHTTTTPARGWVKFPRARRIGVEEMISADLLAQAFGLALDRLVAVQEASDRESNLRAALDSHRLIGQAVGILVERHRLRPAEAFERLKE
ncbi:MAG TPA: response regulator, partial [Propionibacteriaceae bacterium]|nr:response regulator [Propionibacteriaceae bacterium]